MSGIMGLMDIAKTSMAAEQLGVEVTSNNIANVNTPGYSRQRVEFETAAATNYPYGPLGHGVRITGITRAFDPFITAKLDEHTSSLTASKSLMSDLDQVASLFNETQDGGINGLFTDFWNAWQSLSDNPSGSGERQALVNQALTLTEAFNYRANQLVQVRTAITQRVNPAMAEINDHLANIANLNEQILETESNMHQANDLRDQRQLELNRLSELIGVHYYTTGNGTINVALADGTSLVEGGVAWSLQADSSSGAIKIEWQGPGTPPLTKDVTAAVNSGQLAGIIQVRDTFIPQYQADLDDLAKELIAAVNLQHSQGVGLELFTGTGSSNYITNPDLALPLINNPSLSFGDRIAAGSFNLHVEDGAGASTVYNIAIGAGDDLNTLAAAITAATGGDVTATVAEVPPGSGENHLQLNAAANHSFGFSRDTSNVLMALGLNTFFKGDQAYTISVNDALAANTDLIAAGRIDPVSGAHPPGDNNNSLALADLGGQAVGPGGLTFADAYRELVSQIGADAEQAENSQTFYQGLVDQFKQLKDSVSGVSLDDELTNLIMYQRAYQAAARMVSVGDEMLQTLLSIK